MRRPIGFACSLFALSCAAPSERLAAAPAPVRASADVAPTPPPPPPPEPAPPRACDVLAHYELSARAGLLAFANETQLTLFDTKTWKVKSTLTRAAPIGRLLFDRDGKFLAVADQQRDEEPGALSVLRTSDLSSAADFTGVALSATGGDFGFGPDGSLLVARVDKSREAEEGVVPTRIEVWTLDPVERRFELALPSKQAYDGFTFSGRGLLAISGADTLFVLDAVRGKQLLSTPLRPDLPPVFSPDGRTLAFRFAESAMLWSAQDRRVRTLKDPSCDGQGYVFSPDGKLLAVGGFEFAVCVFDTKSGRLQTTLPRPRPSGHAFEDEGMLSPMLFSPDARTLVATELYALRIFDVQRGTSLSLPNASAADWNQNDTRVFERPDHALAILHRGRLQSRIEKGARLVALDLAESEGASLAVSADGSVAARSRDGIELIDTTSGAVLRKLERSAGPENQNLIDVRFDPTGRYLRTGDSLPVLWELASGKRIDLELPCAPGR